MTAFEEMESQFIDTLRERYGEALGPFVASEKHIAYLRNALSSYAEGRAAFVKAREQVLGKRAEHKKNVAGVPELRLFKLGFENALRKGMVWEERDGDLIKPFDCLQLIREADYETMAESVRMRKDRARILEYEGKKYLFAPSEVRRTGQLGNWIPRDRDFGPALPHDPLEDFTPKSEGGSPPTTVAEALKRDRVLVAMLCNRLYQDDLSIGSGMLRPKEAKALWQTIVVFYHEKIDVISPAIGRVKEDLVKSKERAKKWNPPKGYTGANEIRDTPIKDLKKKLGLPPGDETYTMPRSTLRDRHKRDDITGGELEGRVVNNPYTHERFFPNAWVKKQLLTYKPRPQKP